MQNLSLEKAFEIVHKYKIKTAPMAYVSDEKELKQACKKIGFPLAIKVVSENIVHKTEAGGVVLPVNDPEHALQIFRKMKKIRGFEKIIVQKMLKGTELIIGGKRDVQFGPTVIVGLGGIYVELLKDYSIGICPLAPKDADQMLRRLKTFEILKGARTKKAVNFSKIRKIILQVSKLMEKEENILEFDLNPVIANKKDSIAVDARVIVC